MTVEDYILNIENLNIRQLMEAAHEMILDLIPNVCSNIKYKIPFYSLRKNLCYLNPSGNHIYIGFPYGHLLSNEQDILITNNRKQVRHIDIFSLEDLQKESVKEIILEAAIIIEQL